VELPFGPDPRTEKLRALQIALIDHFGRLIRPDSKRRDPVWTLVQGVIGARTKTAISNAATDQLLAHFGSWAAVAAARIETLTIVLYRQTFPEQSAKRLQDCLNTIITERGEVDLRHLSNLSTEDMMVWLEALPGVARKISAGVVNTSTFNRRALVIDTNHRRVIQRLGLVAAKADTTRAFNDIMPVLPDEWTSIDVDEHHLLAKRVGQRYCRPKEWHCEECPLSAHCLHFARHR